MNHFRHFFKALKYSLHGLATAFRDEMAFRQECCLGVAHFIAVCLLPLSLGLRLYLSAVWVLIIVAELLNTAVESVADLVTKQYDKHIEKAKDCASAAVFCLIVLWGLSWGFVLLFS